MSNPTDLRAWLRSTVRSASRPMGAHLLEQWRGNDDPLTHNEARQLAAAMDAAGFSFEPDVRFSGHVLRPADTVVIYPNEDRPIAPSAAYLAAATIARLGVIVASADSVVVAEEQSLLRERTAKSIDLTAAEARRLEAYVEWLLDTPIALDALENEMAGLGDDDRIRIGRFLVAVAGADGYISTPERWMLAGTFSLFGLPADQLEAEIDSFKASRVAPPIPDGQPTETAETIALSPVAVREALSKSDQAMADLAHLMPIAPVEPAPGGRGLEYETSSVRSKPAKMSDWEANFTTQWAALSPADRRRAGSLLGLVPDRTRWHDFIATWKALPLVYWLSHVHEFPHSLAVLFGGFAFFEYEEVSFWPQFERDLWALTDNQTSVLRKTHAAAIAGLGLEMAHNADGDRMTVSSAVHHIGVPLSLWADFLGVADHILRQDQWQSWTSDEWRADVVPRCGGAARLSSFLTANEAAARETICELGEIRDYAIAEPTSTIEDLADITNVSFLRDEYFDDVPETADFFRPDNLLSLFARRCFLRFDDESSRLQVHLPGVQDPKGYMWRVGDQEKAASRDPVWFTVNAAGFDRWIDVHLEGPSGRRTRRITGVGDWGLYDQRRQAFLDLDLRHPSERRMGDYVLVSPRPLSHMTRTGFLEDFPENQAERLSDGTICWITRLSPAGPEGSLSLRWATADGDVRTHTIEFRTRLATRARTMLINGFERPMGDPSLPWYFLRPGPYPPIAYDALAKMELTKMNNQGSATAYARLRRYAEAGIVAPRNKDGAWRLDCEQARITRSDGTLEVRLLGLPSSMWALGTEHQPLSLGLISENDLTYLRATWSTAHEWSVLERLRRLGVAVTGT